MNRLAKAHGSFASFYQKMKNTLIAALLISSITSSNADQEFKLYDPRPLYGTNAIRIDEKFTAFLKPVKNLLEYDKKSLKEVIDILDQYYKNEYSDKMKVTKFNVTYANLIRIGDLGDNFNLDGVFVYYCSSTLTYDTDKKKGGIIENSVLVTLDGKVIPSFTRIEDESLKR